MKFKNAIAKVMISIILCSTIMFILPQGVFAATLFSDGYETGDFSSWTDTVVSTGSIMEKSETNFLEGQYSAVSSLSDTLNTYAFVYKNLEVSTPISRIYHREYIKISTLPPAGAETDLFGIMNVIGSGNHLGTIAIQNDGTNYRWKLEYYNNGISQAEYSTQVNIKADTWYYIEIMVTTGAGIGQVTAWISEDLNVVNQATPTINVANLENSATTIGAVFFGGFVTGASYPVHIYSDSVVVSDTWTGPRDFTAPAIGGISATSRTVNSPVTLRSMVTDDVGLDSIIPSWNNTGTWVNQTAINANGATSYSATLNGTWNNNGGSVVSAIFYAKDTSNNWAASSQSNFTLYSYTVTLTANQTSLIQDDTARLEIAVTKNGAPFTNYIVNVTKDGSSFLNNQVTSFTDKETRSTTHTYAISSLYDNAFGENVAFTTTALNVAWGKATYTVALSANPTSVIKGTTVTISLSVTKNSAPFTDFVANITKDGSLHITNATGSLTEVDLNTAVHSYTVASLIDTLTKEVVTFSTNTLDVSWTQPTATPTPTPTSTPTAKPTATPTPTSTTEPTPTATAKPTAKPTQTSQPTQSLWNDAALIGVIIAVIVAVIIVALLLLRRQRGKLANTAIA